MSRQVRINVACNALGEGLWGFGWNLAAPLTVLPLVVERMGGGPFEIGLLATIGAAGFLVPQILSSLILQTGRGRKTLLVVYHLVALVPPWALMGVIVLTSGRWSSLVSRVSLQVCYAVFVVLVGFIVPVWFDWVLGLFDKAQRGRAFGWSGAAAAVGSTVAALVAGVMTDGLGYPTGHAYLFFVGAVFYVASMLAFLPTYECDGGSVPPRLSRREIFARFGQSLAERNFRHYLVARVLTTAGGGATAFFAVNFTAGGRVTEQLVITLGACVWISQAVVGYLLGRLGDRKGHRIGAALGSVAQIAALAVAAFAAGPIACAAVFALTGVGLASAWVSHNNLLFETCPHDCRTAHITVSNLVLAPVTALVPMATAQAIAVLDMPVTFLICVVPTLAGLVWLVAFVREPRSIAVQPVSADALPAPDGGANGASRTASPGAAAPGA